jgi:[calcium/calmodulin-dependent protein kinase] kinase
MGDVSDVKETASARLRHVSGERTLNQYIIKEVLGKGSYGTVYRGIDTALDHTVAIKELDAKKLKRNKMSKLGTPFGGRGRFVRGRGGSAGISRPQSPPEASNPIDLVRGEIAIMKKLKHRNVVKLFEVLYDPLQVKFDSTLCREQDI